MPAPEITTQDLTLTLFGPMQVHVQSRALPPLRSRKALSLLALLTLRHGRPVEREWLAETLWPDADRDKASASLRAVLSELRQALGAQAERLQSPHRHSLRLELEGVDADVTQFDAAIAKGSPSALEYAVTLYQGPLLEGYSEEWVTSERFTREQSCLRALETLAEIARAGGDLAAAARHWRRAVGLAPWREAARRGLMEALAQDGETNAALEVYREFLEMLRSDPSAAPDPRTSDLYARLRSESRRRAQAPINAAKNEETKSERKQEAPIVGILPHPLTELIGRTDEREEAVDRLRRFRLVTLTGPGGIGKTRLALAVAAAVVPEFPDGVWLAPLEALSNGERAAAQIATVMGLREEPGRRALETLTDHLREKRVLLVMDNCEHLLEASAGVATHLLRNCAGVRILATSRAALGVTGEGVWTVPALATPYLESLTPEEVEPPQRLLAYESVQLFVERAQAVQQTFALTSVNALFVAQICARLQGVPLAIELAAARVKAMTAAQIAARLDDQLSLLTGGSRDVLPRQQTLRAMLDWSHALLSVPEQLMFARLSVFAGGWTLEAAEQVCAENGIGRSQVQDLLRSLVDKSLAAFEMRDEETGGRYRLLETMRQYGAERLGDGAGAEAVRNRHFEWCMTLVSDRYMSGPDAEQNLRRIEREHDNLRAALVWCARNPRGGEAGLRLAGALWPFWYTRGYCVEGRQYLMRALDHPGAQEISQDRALALHAAGTMSSQLCEYSTAKTLLEETLHIRRQTGSEIAVTSALNSLGNVHYGQGEYDKAKSLYEEGLAIARNADQKPHIAWSLTCLGDVAQARRDHANARRLHEESLSIRRSGGDQHSIGFTLMRLAGVMTDLGDYDRARILLEESLSLFRELGGKLHMAWTLNGMGDLAHARGDFDSAQALYQQSLTLFQAVTDLDGIAASLEGAASSAAAQTAPGRAVSVWAAVSALREQVGMALDPNHRAKLDRSAAQARAALGEAAFTAAWEEGRRLSWKQAADIVRQETAYS